MDQERKKELYNDIKKVSDEYGVICFDSIELMWKLSELNGEEFDKFENDVTAAIDTGNWDNLSQLIG